MPGLSLEYFVGTNEGPDARTYPGYQVGVTVPLWLGANYGKVKAAQIGTEIARAEEENYRALLQSHYQRLMAEVQKYDASLKQYSENGKMLAEEILKHAQKAYASGEIDYFQYIQSLDNAISLKLDYLDNLQLYNQTVLELNFLNLE